MIKLSFVSVIAIVGGLASPAFAVSYDSSYWDQTKALDDLQTSSDFKEDYYPLKSSCFGDVDKDGSTDYQVIAMADGIDTWRTAYVYLYHPSGTNPEYYSSFSSKTRTTAGGYRFNISMTTDQSGYKLYSASLINASDDLRFLKYKITGDFTSQSTLDNRLYDFAGFDIQSEDKTKSNDYAQGKRFTFTKDSSGAISQKTDDIKNVKIDGYADDSLLPGMTGKTEDSLGLTLFEPRAVVSTKLKIHNYIFSLDNSLGDLVGIDLHYQLQAMYGSAAPIASALGNYSMNRLDGELIEKECFYYDTKFRSFSSWSSSVVASNIWAGGYAIWATALDKLVYGTSDVSGNVPVIEKLDDPTAKGWIIDGGKLPVMENNPHFMSTTANDYALGLYNSDSRTRGLYIIHYAASDVATVVDLAFQSHFTEWYSQDVKAITLALRKDGKVYYIGVSSNAVQGVQGTSGTASVNWTKIFKLFLTILAGVALVIVSCYVVDWVFSEPSEKGGSSDD